MDQNEIERLLNQSKQEGEGGESAAEQPAAEPAAADTPAAGASGSDTDQGLDQSEIESLLSGAGAKPAEKPAPQAAPPAQATADPDADKPLGQDDIEALLNRSGAGGGKDSGAAAGGQAPPAQQTPRPQDSSPEDGNMPQQDLDYLFDQAQEALSSIDTGDAELPSGVAAFRLEEFPGAPASSDVATLDLIRDVELDLQIELGRTNMYLEDVLKMRKGSVVPLDKMAGDPVDVYVNGRLIARGEVLVLNDNFCVRIAELIAGVHQF